MSVLLMILKSLLSSLSPLLKKKGFLTALLIVALVILLFLACMRIKELEAAVAAKPEIKTQVETVLKTQIVAGPERIVERIVEKPGAERVVTRIIQRGPMVTTTGEETKIRIKEEPDNSVLRPHRWIVGVMANPNKYTDNFRQDVIVRAGYSFFGRLDLTYGRAFNGPGSDRHRLDLAFRF